MAKRKAPSEPLPALDSEDEVPVPLPRMIHALHTVAGVSVVDAIGIVRVLAQKKRHTPSRLRRLSAPELEELGAPCAGPTRDRVVEALREVASSGVMSEAERSSKQQRLREDVRLRRDWGDPGTGREDKSCAFDVVLTESTLRGRSVMVNRAAVLLAWAVVVLECMGFARNEALSLAQCYTSLAAEAHGPAPPTKRVMSENQPHVEFLRVKIPIIRLRHDGEYRGLKDGQVVPPTRAYDYLRRTMFQMLPYVMGALTLLANSYVAADGSAHALHDAAYGLYLDFRPETHGERGKRAVLALDTILDLRASRAQHVLE